eukprot:scaffold1903_cov396-Prasinococcus_capsulatus_cf.AAC.35
MGTGPSPLAKLLARRDMAEHRRAWEAATGEGAATWLVVSIGLILAMWGQSRTRGGAADEVGSPGCSAPGGPRLGDAREPGHQVHDTSYYM